MGGAKAHYDGIVAFSQTDFTEDLKKINVPVLVMHSEDDQIVPYVAAGPLSAKLLKNGTLKTYKVFARHDHDPGRHHQRRSAGIHQKASFRRRDEIVTTMTRHIRIWCEVTKIRRRGHAEEKKPHRACRDRSPCSSSSSRCSRPSSRWSARQPWRRRRRGCSTRSTTFINGKPGRPGEARPGAKMTFEGPPSGAGTVMTWEGITRLVKGR